jgi:hypothetical protein
MTGAESSGVLVEVDQLQKLASADRRPSSVPLLVFGVLTLGCAAFADDSLSLWALAYWVVAGPAGFLLIAAWYRRRRVQLGVGSGRGSYLKTGLVLLAAFALVLPLWAVPLPTIGVALLVLAVRQRNTYLGICAVAFGLLGGLAKIFVFDNALYRLAEHVGWHKATHGYFNGASIMVYAVIGLLMVVAGFVARQRELGSTTDE